MYTLFLSSVFMTLGHLPFIVVSHEASFIKCVYLTGCATSLANHYFQSKNRALQVLDRTVMVLGSVNDLFYMSDSTTFSYWVLAIYFYMYSKVFRSLGHHENVVPFHILYHLFVTMCHARVLVHF